MEKTKIQTPPGKQEIIVTRKYKAPRDLVYRTVTDPRLIPQWWGPRYLTTEVERMEVRPGGQWRFVQRDPQGNIFAFHGVYHEAKAPERLVFTMEWEGMPGHVLLDIESFEEHDGITTCISKNIFETVEDRDGMLQTGMEGGAQETTERLTELLANEGMHKKERQVPVMEQMQENGECITVTYTFDAPRKEVWTRWTDPSQYMCWWGPKDFTAPYAKFDLRPGGKYLTCMRDPDGKELWDTGEYKEIDPYKRIVYTATWSDEQGDIVPPSYYGMGGDQPVDMSVQVNLEDIDGKTRLTLEHCGFTGGDNLDLAKAGWMQSFDKLADCLS